MKLGRERKSLPGQSLSLFKTKRLLNRATCIPETTLYKAFHEGIVYGMTDKAFLGRLHEDIIVVFRHCLFI
ncbi:hypothetical protein GZ78_05840 [Endozoicomonas numazuensis]|uniref:Uncharacterized protein n=1 Tax=Endozoicomonas numazuensis TaxID=1137799 RepID=A0A081NLY4_9GAMM|nr:hypothetical protein GZ78_05840 [Endozoicomonas numazuensis]